MRRSIILHRARALSASCAQPRCRTISKIARISRAADWVMNVMSETSAKPSSFNCDMYACSNTFTWAHVHPVILRLTKHTTSAKIKRCIHGNPSQSYWISDTSTEITRVTRPDTECLCLNPNQTEQYSTYSPQKNGRLSWPRWLAYCRHLSTNSHPST